LRVISGFAKGRHLKTPRGKWVRPTSDRVKESLFNILASKIPASVFLDLFAGSGSIGIEALSRGCTKAIFVDINPRAILFIKDNLSSLGFTGKARIFKLDVLKALDLFKKQNLKFDIVFMDPPYFKKYEVKALEKTNESGLLKKGGTVVIESSKKTILPSRVGDFFLYRRTEYGDTALNFYQKIWK